MTDAEMSDIVERLRDMNAEIDAIDRMLDEAADEIERLQAAKRRALAMYARAGRSLFTRS